MAYLQPGSMGRYHVPATPALEGVDIHSIYDMNSAVVLGKGGFSEVLAVRHIPTGSMRALKVMDRAVLTGKKGEMVAHEREILRRTAHPNIVTLHETIQNMDRVYFALDVMNEDLFEFIVRNKRINETLSRKIIFQVLCGIRYLHEHSIVHRDIKPENVLINVMYDGADDDVFPSKTTMSAAGSSADDLTASSARSPSKARPGMDFRKVKNINDFNADDLDVEVKLADFGLAKLILEWDVKSTPCGTSFYIAPEVIRGIESQGAKPLCTTQRLVKSVDVWSAGVVLFVLLCGRPPFHGQVKTGEERRALLRRIDRGVLFDPSHGWDAISDEAKDLLMLMLEQDSSRRITADQCLRHPFFVNHGMTNIIMGGDPVQEEAEKQKLAAKLQKQQATTNESSSSHNDDSDSRVVNYTAEGSASVKPDKGKKKKGFFRYLFSGSSRNTEEQRQMHEELEALHREVIAADDVEGDTSSYRSAPVMEAKPSRPAVMNSKAKVGPGALKK